MKATLSLLGRAVVPGLAIAFSSCSTAKRNDSENNSGLLGKLLIDGVDSADEEETYAELKQIADSPSSHLQNDSGEEETEDSIDLEAPPAPVDPTVAWKRNGVEPRRISIGDIFSENMGPVLNKKVSLADELPAEKRRTLLDRISSEKDMRVPMTLSQAEIDALREEANPAKPFPTRSVALDFKTSTRSADIGKLQKLFAGAENGDAPEGLDPEDTRKKISGVKKQLEDGERLFTVVGVTRSDRLEATYPGAPVGSRDAESIRNAVEVLYPHLDSLKAAKEGESVEITRDEGIYWEFEARELKLEDGEIVIDKEAVVNQ